MYICGHTTGALNRGLYRSATNNPGSPISELALIVISIVALVDGGLPLLALHCLSPHFPIVYFTNGIILYTSLPKWRISRLCVNAIHIH